MDLVEIILSFGGYLLAGLLAGVVVAWFTYRFKLKELDEKLALEREKMKEDNALKQLELKTQHELALNKLEHDHGLKLKEIEQNFENRLLEIESQQKEELRQKIITDVRSMMDPRIKEAVEKSLYSSLYRLRSEDARSQKLHLKQAITETIISDRAFMRELAYKIKKIEEDEPDYINEFGMEFVLIKPGTFLMGSEKGLDDEKPVHEVENHKAILYGKISRHAV